ncbi:MAG: ketopantoate reductase family protein [Moraxellaceae bacterium]
MKTPSTLPENLSWHVLGAGAIGGLWALRLARLGFAVTLLAHDDNSNKRELQIEEDGVLFSQRFAQKKTAAAGPVQCLLVCTKSNLTATALSPLLPQLAAGTPVLLLQNGMGAENWLRQQHPELCLLTGISTDGVWRRDRDHLVQAGRGETVIGAEQAQDASMAQQLATLMQDERWPVHFSADITQRRWLKLAMNCAINPLTALYRCRNGELLEKPEALAIMRAVCAEVAAVMSAEGMPTDTDTLFKAATAAAAKTAANISSMHTDVAAGRETEIAFINGHVVARAAAHGIPAPSNTALLTQIQALPTQ